MRMMKRSVAKGVMLTAVVLSTFSIAGALATHSKDGGGGPCPAPIICPCR